jgi:hypothetical protein
LKNGKRGGGYWYHIDTTGRVVALPTEKATDVVVAVPPEGFTVVFVSFTPKI